MPKDIMKEIFVKGLKLEIKVELVEKNLHGLIELMDVDISTEKCILIVWKGYDETWQKGGRPPSDSS